MTTSSENGRGTELPGMQTPPVVSAEEWKAAWKELHVKEKAHSRAHDDGVTDPDRDEVQAEPRDVSRTATSSRSRVQDGLVANP